MNREQVMNSVALKKRFCKDCGLPIVVYDNPYFYERLCVLDVMFDCVDKFEDFCCELQKFNDEQAYFEYYNTVKDKVIEHIKGQKDFVKFNEETFSADYKYQKRNLYIEDNNRKTFISIDMKKANFSALNYYSSDIFDNCSSWENFMEMFTDSEHIINSKYIRQVILGACNPKRQIHYEKFLMNQLLQHMIEQIDTLYVYSLGEDEILLYTDDCGYSMKKLSEAIDSSPIGKLVRMTMFDLERIDGTSGWLKTIYDFGEEATSEDVIEFKCLDAEIYHQIVKHYYNEVITDNDLVFYHNGKLAKFLDEVNNPWK